VPLQKSVDLLVIGAGINGAGIARDAAGRGLTVLLCDQGDIGGATSSASTKLIHGGLRYLEQYEFRLVREALREREVLLALAPHLIQPLRLILPHDKAQRPAWMIRLGLFIYDHLGGRKRLPASHALDLNSHPGGRPLIPGYGKGFVYSDCRVDDSRLVILNAKDASERGAEVLPRTQAVSARRFQDHWLVDLESENAENSGTARARAVVNAGGPWANQVLYETLQIIPDHLVRLVKGSHIVVPAMFDHDDAYLFQNPDGRIVFAIPFEGNHTLIGTTEADFQGDPATAEITPEETSYLCECSNRYFSRKISPDDVIWSFAGVRPLFDDGAGDATSASRDYLLEFNGGADRAPLLSVLGGKITTYRSLAEEALERLSAALGSDSRPWTSGTPLPGGDMEGADFSTFLESTIIRFPWLPDDLRLRYAHAYGTRIESLLDGINDMNGLGENFGGGLYSAEADYLIREEWAQTADDILWRRSKLGLTAPPHTRDRLAQWLRSKA